MKAVILAAGKGTRLIPLTEDKPKVMVEINGKPFLYYVLKNLVTSGIKDVVLVIGYKKQQIIDYVDSEFSDLKITFVEQKEMLGTGHALLQAETACGNENFIILYGDNLYSPEDLKNLQKEDSLCYVSARKVSNPEKYGVLIIDQETNKLKKIIEKPKTFVGSLVNLGFYKFTKDIWPSLHKLKLSERNEYELTDAVSDLAEQGKVEVVELKDYWLDLGCKEDISNLEKNFKELNIK